MVLRQNAISLSFAALRRGTRSMTVNSRGVAMAANAPLDLTDLNQLLEALPHKLWFGQVDGRLSYCNGAARACAGGRELEQPTDFERGLIHPDDLAHVLDARQT